MKEDFIQLPELKEIQEMLTNAKIDIQTEVKENPDLASLSQLLMQVIEIIEEKINKHQDLNKLGGREKIDIAAYLNFLQGLLEDFFFYDEEDFEEEFEENDVEQ